MKKMLVFAAILVMMLSVFSVNALLLKQTTWGFKAVTGRQIGFSPIIPPFSSIPIKPVCKDTDSSPDYALIGIPGPEVQQNNADLFVRAQATGVLQSGILPQVTGEDPNKCSQRFLDPSAGYATFMDCCTDTSILTESFCKGSTGPFSIQIKCANGCKDGVCLKTAQQCTDTDGGKMPNVKGVTTAYDGYQKTDVCHNPMVTASCSGPDCYLSEYYCTEGQMVGEDNINCPYGCSDGMCVNATAEKTCEQMSSDPASKQYYLGCQEAGYETICFNKFTGIYQGCGWNDPNTCTANNVNADKNLRCDVPQLPPPQYPCKDSDNSPNYIKEYSSFPITPEKDPALFTKGIAKGDYQSGGPSLIGMDPNPGIPKPTAEPYTTAYDYCEGSVLAEAFCLSNGRVSTHGLTCPTGCKDGACMKEPAPEPSDIFPIQDLPTNPLNVDEPMGNVIETVIAKVWTFLKDGTIGNTDYNQYLRFNVQPYNKFQNLDARSGSVIYAKNELGQTGHFLFFKDGDVMFEFEIEFENGLKSSLVNGRLVDLEGKTIPLFKETYSVADATVDVASGNVKIRLTGPQEIVLVDNNFADMTFYPGGASVNNEQIEDAGVRIMGAPLNGVFELSAIRYRLRADAKLGDVYVPQDGSLRQQLDEPQGLLGSWDIFFAGVTGGIAKVYLGPMKAQVCTDSDGGRKYYEKGAACEGSKCFTDYCQDADRIFEFDCGESGGIPFQDGCGHSGLGDCSYTCPAGCQDGACLMPVVPKPPELSCQVLQKNVSTAQYFTLCSKEGYDNVCFNKYTGVYQGCTKNNNNDCTQNNMNADQNVLCPVGIPVVPQPPVQQVSERVTCMFRGSRAAQKCYSDKGECSGRMFCVVAVTGARGEKVTWKSTCGGYATTTMDGRRESAVFACRR